MPDNLTISISADTTKLRADLDVAKAQFRELGREIKKAADEARVSGDRSGLLVLEKQAQALTNTMVGLQRQMRSVHAESATAWRRVTENVTDFAKGMSPIAGYIGDIKAGLVGLAAAEGLKKFAEQIAETTQKILELKRQAAGTGQAPEMVLAMREVAKQLGMGEDEVIKPLFKIQQAYREIRIEARNAGQVVGDNLTVIRGNAMQTAQSMQMLTGDTKDLEIAAKRLPPMVFRGAGAPQINITDARSAMEALGIRAETFADTVQGQRDLFTALSARLRAFGEAGGQYGDIAQRAGVALIGKSYKEAADWLGVVGTKLDEVMKKQRETGQAAAATKENQVAAQELNTAWVELQGTVEGLSTSLTIKLMPALTGLVQIFNTLISQQSQFQAGKDLTDRALQMAPGASPFASGGQVPGFGSGDTVPAMLTPGEFVNRTASVQYYGADFFRALNARMLPRDVFRGFGYALGGLVDSIHRPTHFAEGGMVESAGGRMVVDLHMGGHSFEMSSDQVVASRLVRFARSESMRSAGIKPSWVS